MSRAETVAVHLALSGVIRGTPGSMRGVELADIVLAAFAIILVSALLLAFVF
jgi:hypothetical protein